MAQREPPNGLDKSVRLRRQRRERAAREGERSLAQNLAWMGTLGWLIVAPTLAGMFLGRFVDRSLGGGIMFSSLGCLLGLVAGCWIAWRRVQRS
jgi:ATP synthase protein I